MNNDFINSELNRIHKKFDTVFVKLDDLKSEMHSGFSALSEQLAETKTRVSVVESELENKASITDLQACELRNKKKNSVPPPLYKSDNTIKNIAVLLLKILALLAAGGAGGATFFN
jgi:septation ring formation regulator EzrA